MTSDRDGSVEHEDDEYDKLPAIAPEHAQLLAIGTVEAHAQLLTEVEVSPEMEDSPVGKHLVAAVYGTDAPTESKALLVGFLLRQRPKSVLIEGLLRDIARRDLKILRGILDDARAMTSDASVTSRVLRDLIDYEIKRPSDETIAGYAETLRDVVQQLDGSGEGAELARERGVQALNTLLTFKDLKQAADEILDLPAPLALDKFASEALSDAVVEAAGKGRLDDVRQVGRALANMVVEQRFLERILVQWIGISVKARDEAAIDAALRLVPAVSTMIVSHLAYAAACVLARRGDRDGMLPFVSKAGQLGRPKKQFLEEAAFKPFLDDPAFQSAVPSR